MATTWEQERIKLEMAGMLRETAEGTTLERLLVPGYYFAARDVALEDTEDGFMLVTTDESWNEWKNQLEYEPGLLEPFIRLSEGSADDVLAFAQDHGMLGICSAHWSPWTHKYVLGGSDCRPAGREKVEAWFMWTNEFRAILSVAEALHHRRVPPRAAWKELMESGWIRDADPYLHGETSAPPRAEFKHLQELVGVYLDMADVSPLISYDPPQWAMFSRTLLGNLLVELAFATMNVDGLAICSGCAVPFVPSRRPSTGRRIFCKRCRANRVPQKLAMRDYRARKP
jgi:hypothetical protein